MAKENLIIRTEKQLFEAVEALTVKEIDYEDVTFDFDNLDEELSEIKIIFRGDNMHGSLTMPVMEALIALQKSLYKSYADLQYNGNVLKLTDDEKKHLELVIQVKDGSTELVAEIRKILKILNKMSPKIVIPVAITLTTGFVLNSSIGKYADYKIKEQEIFVKQKLALATTEQDRNRREHELKLLAAFKGNVSQASKKHTAVEDMFRARGDERGIAAMTSSIDAAEHLFKAAKTVDEIELSGVVTTSDAAKLIATPQKSEVKLGRRDGAYVVTQVDTDKPDIFRVKVRNIENQEEFWTIVQDDTTNNDNKKVIKDAEWSKSPLGLKIQTEENKGKIKKAVIIQAIYIEPDDANHSKE